MEARTELPSPQYRSLERRAWLAQRWIGFTGVLALAVLGLNVAYLNALGDAGEAVAIEGLVGVSYLAQLCIHILGAGIFIAWFFRAYSNVRALGVPFLRHDRGWAIFGWFVPIVSLFWPKRMANDAWRAAEPGAPANDKDWLKRPVAPLLHCWWAAWLLSTFADNLWGRLDENTIDQTRTATVVGIVAQSLYVVAAVLCILVIRRLTARMEARAHAAEVPVLELSEDDRVAAEQAVRHDHDGLGRRIAWYFAGAALLLIAIAAGASAEGEASFVQIGIGVGVLVLALVVGVGVVQLVGRLARRRPPVWSGWAALIAVLVAVAGAAAQDAQRTNSSNLSAPTQAVDAANADPAAACPERRFRPGPLPSGYRYSKLTRKERRDLLHRMQLPPALERRTTLVYVVRRNRVAALVTAMPSGGRPDDFLHGYLGEAQRNYGKRKVTTEPMSKGIAQATLVTTPEEVTAIAGDTCVGVAVLGAARTDVRRLIWPVMKLG